MFSEKCAKKYHVKKGDAVEVISGEWKKETGKIVAVLDLAKRRSRRVLRTRKADSWTARSPSMCQTSEKKTDTNILRSE